MAAAWAGVKWAAMVLWAAVLEEWVATVWLVVMAAAWAAVVETVGGMSGALGVGAMMPTGPLGVVLHVFIVSREVFGLS